MVYIVYIWLLLCLAEDVLQEAVVVDQIAGLCSYET